MIRNIVFDMGNVLIDYQPMEYTRRFFTIVAETKNFYANCTRAESKIILRYHSQAILGLLQEWTEEDTEQLDQIVHTVFLLITTGIPPKNRS